MSNVQQPPVNSKTQKDENNKDPDSDSDPESDSEQDSDSESEVTPKKEKGTQEELYFKRRRETEQRDTPKYSNTEEENIKRLLAKYRSPEALRKKEEKERGIKYIDEVYDFPPDNERWFEQDLKEKWADAPYQMKPPGWDPAFATEEDWEVVLEEIRKGRDPPIAPFYMPYRKYYPAIPDNHFDIQGPKDVIEELDRTEEFLKWVSYIFRDGSSYEGTVWDDLAHGKGVFIGGRRLTRYEGEWLQNNMEGHGVVEVDIPDIEPIPGSTLEAEMRAEGKIIKRDYMSPEDRKWLEMDIEDSVKRGRSIVPFYERETWIDQYGMKPEKGRYRYAGQWKHSRMHGCGVYELNEEPIFGRFYFGQLLDDPAGCTPEICTMHAGIAEVAAAKARMFINKPDGMVREERGPFSDPQHPYFYEEEDVWQAPGFINQFYEVPDYWKTYVQEVDQEREMWLNSFYKAPLRLPMPAELEHWWENERPPEFVILNKEPEPDPEDPSKLIYTEDPVIMHTPTGRIINYIEDEEHGVRLFWQPPTGENVDPTKVEFLPLGFDEFYGRDTEGKKEGLLLRLLCSIDNACKPWFEKLEKWTEEKKKESELRRQLLEQELELAEAELSLEEAIEDMEEALKRQEKEADNKMDTEAEEENLSAPPPLAVEPEEKASLKKGIKEEDEDEEEEEEQEEEEDEDEDDSVGVSAPSSFGSVADTKDKKKGPGRSPFSTLSFASSSLLSTIPSVIENSFSMWKKGKSPLKAPQASCSSTSSCMEYAQLVSLHQLFPENMSLKAKTRQADKKFQAKRGRGIFTASQKSGGQSTYSRYKVKGHRSWEFDWLRAPPERNSDRILSLHIPIECLDSCMG